MARRLITVLVILLLAGIVLFAAFAWRVEIAPVAPPAPTSFDAAAVTRGASLAALGNCAECHTAANGKAYAGSYPVQTPYGTIYGTNITPDPATGIGRWSLEAFSRAMREGVDREGRHLYPAFPYTHFTLVDDADLQALYAYLMTREPAQMQAPANELPFPLQFRPLLAGWKLLFFDERRFQPQAAQDAEWNRGAYLSRGLGHCGACHTPRNALGAEKLDAYLSGGEAQGWHAPALNAQSRTPIPWTADALLRYLRFGSDPRHEVAAGPMAPVVQNLARVPEGEVRAIAGYFASYLNIPEGDREKRTQAALARATAPAPTATPTSTSTDAATSQIGATLYNASCAVCHSSASRPPFSPGRQALHLALSTSIALPEPGNLIRIILQGMAPPDGTAGPMMPGYAGAFTDEQVVALVQYVRTSFSDQPAWTDVGESVRAVRRSFGSSARSASAQ